jgi:hypothetical protein
MRPLVYHLSWKQTLMRRPKKLDPAEVQHRLLGLPTWILQNGKLENYMKLEI